MSYVSLVSNYGGRQPNTTSYIKSFVVSPNINAFSSTSSLWSYVTGSITNITTSIFGLNVLLTGNLIMDGGTIYGNLIAPSDITLKENIKTITENEYNKLLEFIPSQYNFKSQKDKKRYGFIAQELEKVCPELVHELKMDGKKDTIKMINYDDVIPLLVAKIQNMQSEINDLKNNYNHIIHILNTK